jgi:hypothetical protein
VANYAQMKILITAFSCCGEESDVRPRTQHTRLDGYG